MSSVPSPRPYRTSFKFTFKFKFEYSRRSLEGLSKPWLRPHAVNPVNVIDLVLNFSSLFLLLYSSFFFLRSSPASPPVAQLWHVRTEAFTLTLTFSLRFRLRPKLRCAFLIARARGAVPSLACRVVSCACWQDDCIVAVRSRFLFRVTPLPSAPFILYYVPRGLARHHGRDSPAPCARAYITYHRDHGRRSLYPRSSYSYSTHYSTCVFSRFALLCVEGGRLLSISPLLACLSFCRSVSVLFLVLVLYNVYP